MSCSEFERALRAGDREAVLIALDRFANYELRSPDDAQVVAELLGRLPSIIEDETSWRPALRSLLGLFQQVETQDAFETLAKHGLPRLRHIFDGLWSEPESPHRTEDLLFATKILVLYHDPADLPRVAAAARDASLGHDSLWAVIFQSVGEGYPLQAELIAALRDPLPVSNAAIAFLDWLNSIAVIEPIEHPFDTAAGRDMIARWLSGSEGRSVPLSQTAAVTLRFLNADTSGELIELAARHPLAAVRLQAAFVAGKQGDRDAIEQLSQACLDPRVSATAVQHLEQLGELNAIPARAKNPDFMALAEMCRWLSHPMEFGVPPDEVQLVDRRMLIWPPANDSRTLWLVRYLYRGTGADGIDESGIGMVGSITFALYGEVTADMPPEDVYAIHCCWELEAEEDARAPADRTVAAGRDLLRRSGNRGF